MPIRLYNTLSKREEELTTIESGKVRMYTCGPTVYGRPHIGNYSSFLMADLLRRWLQFGHRMSVTHVKNITDVGHLLHDADSGDDKVQSQAEKEKNHPLDVARRFEQEYIEDEEALRILPPQHRPRASEFIKEQLAIIKTLLQKGHAYETPDGIYFSVTSPTPTPYGTLSGNTLKDLSAGARVEVDQCKHHPADFALWKKCVGDNAKHVLRWNFATGDSVTTVGDDPSAGFPGWHIECSAMSSALLGEQIDIHTGGEDNIFPHHECEIAQSESCSGKTPFVRLWLHKRRIDLAGAKMSKSLGNILTVPSIIERGYSPLDLRYYLLSVHYRTNLKFAWKGMDDARLARQSILDWMERPAGFASDQKKSDAGSADVQTFQEKFFAALDDDLNTPASLAAVFECLHWSYSHVHSTASLEAIVSFQKIIRDVFGCFESAREAVPIDVQDLLHERERARQQKDFAGSDKLRTEIEKRGFSVQDTSEGQVVRKMH